MFEAYHVVGSRYPTRVTLKRVDVAKFDEVETWINEAVQDHGRLDGAANVAGMAGGEGQMTEDIVRIDGILGPLSHSLTLHSQVQKDWERMISVNLTGVMNCMRSQLQKISRPGGSIVNVSSTSGLRGLAKNAAYASSKFGVIGLTESAAAEYGKQGVRINALLPSVIVLPTKVSEDC
jgi:NAD(P)-dependent dehydrogenase (short-subunit alcohol dehydrogenase family)